MPNYISLQQLPSLSFVNMFYNIFFSVYYINTNEIPGELLREILISSHVKITCYLHMWKYHRCYCYIINRAFHTKKLLKWNGLVVHWCFFHCCAHSWNIFQHSKRNFVSPRDHVISSICVMVWLRITYTWLHDRMDFHLPCLWSLQKTLPHQVSFILKRKKRRIQKHAISLELRQNFFGYNI